MDANLTDPLTDQQAIDLMRDCLHKIAVAIGAPEGSLYVDIVKLVEDLAAKTR